MSTTNFRVVVTDFISEPLTCERELLGDLATVEAPLALSEADLVGRVETCDAIMLYHFISLTAATIDRLERCRLIVRCGVGYDNVDLAAAKRRGIPVANVPDYGSEEVADSAIGMLLSLTRGINRQNTELQAGRGPWIYETVRPLHRLRGRSLGIVGLGRIGIATAIRAKALGLAVSFYDPYVPDGLDKAVGVRRVESFEQLARESEILSFHCPRTAETQHMLNATTVRWLPRGAYVVNTARGGVVHAAAVVDALADGHLAGAALDVLEVEPPAADDPVIRAWRDPSHPAWSRLILNPHAAFYSEEGLLDMRIKGSQNVRRVLLGDAPRNRVG